MIFSFLPIHRFSYKEQVCIYNTIEISLNYNPEDELINTQKIENILSHIKKLKKDYRILIKMRYFEGMTYKEMEEKINTPLNTIKVKLFRAKKILIQSIEKNK